MTQSPLDNPVWSALTTTHAALAIGDGAARRYPEEICPMVGIATTEAAGYDALREVLPGGSRVPLFLDTTAPPPFPVLYARDIDQMVLPGAVPPLDPGMAEMVRSLEAESSAEMLELVALTKPGPFGPRTVELGDYVGIRDGGRLVAMAGVRLRPVGFSEISGVCVHPDWQGRGYGRAVTQAVAARVAARGETAFLHVKTDNLAARNAYLKLGFQVRRTIHLRVVSLP